MIIDCYRTHTHKGAQHVAVFVDGRGLTAHRSQRLRNHSPDGFNWGYGGSGPAQLALAILLEAGCSDAVALAHYQAFKAAFLQSISERELHINLDVDVWLLRQETARHQSEVRR